MGTRSAPLRKSFSDLTRRRARSVLSLLTLAMAVASISFLAIPTLIDRAMQDEVRAGRLADLRVNMQPVVLTGAQLAALAALPNVVAVEPHSSVDLRVFVGERRAPARVIGVRDFGHQSVDLVRLESGALPASGQVLADVQDANVGVYAGGAGATLDVIGRNGERIPFEVSGRGRSLPGGEVVQDENIVVIYAATATVAALGGQEG
jgi:hypothetical protein